eukprot:TRINITY_DN6032_c0_g2_i1.p1 TRINITY_DN6032_c0_g2~~TRINITY_DN6032_c0_g2_i1.p1  ORF type:complete len:290 (-),score=47.78 TRINITY_DN6032_c0_g2_i1:137-946(-)
MASLSRSNSMDLDDESIYNLIPRPQKQVTRAAMHRSKYPGTTPPTGSTFAKHANLSGAYTPPSTSPSTSTTFGPPQPSQTSVNPKAFLRKHSREPRLPSAHKFTYTEADRKPSVPSRHEQPVFGLRSNKNFVTANAIENILAEPRRPEEKGSDYLNKPDYGQVPAYLAQVKQQIEEEYKTIRAAQQTDETDPSHPKMRLLSEEERVELLTSLKKKWEKTNQEYQAMTHIVKLDTVGKVRRKEQYESTLAQLEKDIERVDRRYVYVYDDS